MARIPAYEMQYVEHTYVYMRTYVPVPVEQGLWDQKCMVSQSMAGAIMGHNNQDILVKGTKRFTHYYLR
jgi:hypothetical protein